LSRYQFTQVLLFLLLLIFPPLSYLSLFFPDPPLFSRSASLFPLEAPLMDALPPLCTHPRNFSHTSFSCSILMSSPLPTLSNTSLSTPLSGSMLAIGIHPFSYSYSSLSLSISFLNTPIPLSPTPPHPSTFPAPILYPAARPVVSSPPLILIGFSHYPTSLFFLFSARAIQKVRRLAASRRRLQFRGPAT